MFHRSWVFGLFLLPWTWRLAILRIEHQPLYPLVDEQVQRRAARFVANDYHTTSSDSKMLQKLEWPTLEERRRETRLVMLRKIINRELEMKITLEGIRPAPTRQRRGRNKQLEIHFCNKDLRQNAFLPRTIREWNGLSRETVDAPSAASYKNKLCLGLPQQSASFSFFHTPTL